MKHFPNEAAALAYVMPELIATLTEDLRSMEHDEHSSYSDADREEIRNRIADLEAIADRVNLDPVSEPAQEPKPVPPQQTYTVEMLRDAYLVFITAVESSS